MEPQAYPDRRDAAGNPQIPYDIAGWTLPAQMGVQVDSIEAPFQADLSEVTDVHLTPPPGRFADADNAIGFAYSHQSNVSTLAVNRLLAAGDPVAWAGEAFSGADTDFPAGTIVVSSADAATHERLQTLARELGLDVTALTASPEVSLHALRRPRIALYKSWVANMDEGWTRWLLESYEFEVDTLHDADLATADLAAYDAVLLPSQDSEELLNGHAPNTMPAAYTNGMGLQGALALKTYVEHGGTIVALDEASDFAIEQFGLPVRNIVAGTPAQQFFIPGSLIKAEVNTNHPLAYGMQEEIATSFQRSRAFEVVRQNRTGEGGREETAQAPEPPVETVVRYAEDDLLMSGWALGEDRIAGKGAMMNVQLGEGHVVLFGFRPQFRGQPRGSYKLLMNALQGATLDQLPAVESDATTLPSPQRP
jgi:hypothetical protein